MSAVGTGVVGTTGVGGSKVQTRVQGSGGSSDLRLCRDRVCCSVCSADGVALRDGVDTVGCSFE